MIDPFELQAIRILIEVLIEHATLLLMMDLAVVSSMRSRRMRLVISKDAADTLTASLILRDAPSFIGWDSTLLVVLILHSVAVQDNKSLALAVLNATNLTIWCCLHDALTIFLGSCCWSLVEN